MASFKWISKRFFRKNKDPVSSSALLVALVLSLSYGTFVSVTDIGLLGIHSCTVSTSFQDFPASIKSDSDALAIISANLINGTDPDSIQYHRCDAAHDVNHTDIDTKSIFTVRVCDKWYNATYGDSSAFSILNSTDSDVLMPRYLAHDDWTIKGASDLNIFLLGISGQTLTDPAIQRGLAVLPHENGVRMIVGVPQLNPNQTVTVPKTLALEAEIGCMSVGLLGERSSMRSAIIHDWNEFFVPEAIYLQGRLSSYSGPDYLQEALADTADEIRAPLLQYFNSSTTFQNGFYPNYNVSSYGQFSSATRVSTWTLNDFMSWDPAVDGMNVTESILINCGVKINKILNTSYPSYFTRRPAPCALYQISGSYMQDRNPSLRINRMICATTTQVNMLSAILAMERNGTLTYNLTHFPSDLHVSRTSYFDKEHHMPDDGITTYTYYDSLIRYTLSNNPTGSLRHYIYQELTSQILPEFEFTSGSGSMGVAISQVGSVMVTSDFISKANSNIGIIDKNYFSTNFSAQEVTRWAGGVGASYLLSSIGYNGWAARGSQPHTIVDNGGQEATCYSLRYALAFLPLSLACPIIIIWVIVMSFNSRARRANTLQQLYGGLSTIIEYPYPWNPPTGTHLEWQNYPEPHLIPAPRKEDPQVPECQIFLSNGKQGHVLEDYTLHVGENVELIGN